MIEKRNTIIAWIVFGLIAASNIAAITTFFTTIPGGERPSLFTAVFPFVPVLFAFVGALIISRQPRNVIGLVMMLPGLSLAFVVDAYFKPLSHRAIAAPGLS